MSKSIRSVLPLLNLNVEGIRVFKFMKIVELPLVKMTREEHKNLSPNSKFTMISENKDFKVRVTFHGSGKRPKAHAVFLTDSKEHKLPDNAQ